MSNAGISNHFVKIKVFPSIGDAYTVEFSIEAYTQEEIENQIDRFVCDHLPMAETYQVEKIN